MSRLKSGIPKPNADHLFFVGDVLKIYEERRLMRHEAENAQFVQASITNLEQHVIKTCLARLEEMQGKDLYVRFGPMRSITYDRQPEEVAPASIVYIMEAYIGEMIEEKLP